jgi:hypothetical protein
MLISRKKYEEISDRVKELREEKKKHGELKIKYEILSKEYETIKNQTYNDIAECDFSVDFKKMNACSIERLLSNDNREVTIIGFIPKDCQGIKKWMLHCSRETHNALVEVFNTQVE